MSVAIAVQQYVYGNAIVMEFEGPLSPQKNADKMNFAKNKNKNKNNPPTGMRTARTLTR